MSENYKIILDEDRVKDFINWLPDLEEHEVFYVCLFARKKYCKDIVRVRSDKEQMKRFTCKKEYLLTKLRQLECPYGAYTSRGEPIPQEALVPYITPNPRSLIKAGVNSLKKLADLVTRKYEGWNPHQEIMSEIQKAWSRKIYFDLDIDLDLDQEKQYLQNNPRSTLDVTMEILEDYLNPSCIDYLITRGGLHILIKVADIEKQYVKNWYKNITQAIKVDVRGDNMIPIPGCTQGGFEPYFL